MKRFWLVSLVVVLAAAMAIPAFGEHDLGGFYRAKGWLSNYQAFGAGNVSGSLSSDPNTSAYVEQRARFKFTFTNNEWAKAVWYLESDAVWGDTQFNRVSAAQVRNAGGGLGADTTSIEVKNLYVWFTFPDTDWKFQVGIQNFNDAYWGNIIGVNDTGGIVGWYKTDPVNWRFGWLKFSEQNTSGNAGGGTFFADDLDFYLVEGSFKASESFDLGINLYFMDDNRNRAGNQGTPVGGIPTIGGGSTADLYVLGADGTYKLDTVTLSGFLAFQFGEVTSKVAGVGDRDIAAFGANLRGDFKLGEGTCFVEGMWLSGDDNSTDADIEGWQVSPGVNSPFYYRSDMQILFYNGDDETTATALFSDGNKPGNADGRGVITIMAGYKQNITDSWIGKIGLGWATDAEGNSSGAGLQTQEKSAIEINGYLNYLVTKGLTVGAYGAWAFLSDVPSAADPAVEADDIYMAYWRVNYSF